MSIYVHEHFVGSGLVAIMVEVDIADILLFDDYCMAEQLYCQMLEWA